MSDWIDLPRSPLVRSVAPPVLVEAGHLDEFVARVTEAGATCVNVDVSHAARSFDVVEALKSGIPFPDWRGSSWDSIDDAFEDLRAGWSFPLAVVLQGFERLFAHHQHVALQTTIQLADVERACSVAGDQLIVVYEGASWS